MRKLAVAIALFLVSHSAFASQSECGDHYAKEGSFFGGRTFHAWREYPGIPNDAAFDMVSHAVLNLGFSITNSDKASGSISAQHGVMGSPATVPLNAVIKAAGDGSRIELTFAPQGGVIMSEDRVRSGFCDILNAVVSDKSE
jgi:hypothetical protein